MATDRTTDANGGIDAGAAGSNPSEARRILTVLIGTIPYDALGRAFANGGLDLREEGPGPALSPQLEKNALRQHLRDGRPASCKRAKCDPAIAPRRGQRGEGRGDAYITERPRQACDPSRVNEQSERVWSQ